MTSAHKQKRRPRTTSKSQAAYDAVRERILDRTYEPGYRLVLQTIADELNCSVVPVREAIRRLEAEGLIEFTRNKGATVAEVDTELYLNTMQTLAILEGTATALAAEHISASDVQAARDLNEQMRALLADFDPAEFTRLNTELHALLYSDCPNTHLLDLVHRGWTRMDAIRVSSFDSIPARAHDSVAEHAELIEAIAAKKPATHIEALARAHRMHTLNAYLEAMGRPASSL
ncbi:GntR family transcriptional regulator [Pseudoglutamicibacter cumminsii]|uniref:GntR family transcriptional regulator n=1 Tax=Pseudoglutamicibacter cumminsii TaxID=156979 RepID=UPI0021A56C7F|nr:GntR family transcriptional regulator [Pseudoglutamicibacter cumminsii]MCT1686780.1 GntR family transcriptional regulator [Pseudoglutamicibacter cumminsii]